MTSPISAYQPGRTNDLAPSNAATGSYTASVAGGHAPATPTPSSSDTATITQTAQLQAQLLASARSASGINQAAVTRLSAAINSGSYNVPADKLASAIQASAGQSQGSS
jgi:flagellar biosynthesis anti-sigma factor FlgM